MNISDQLRVMRERQGRLDDVNRADIGLQMSVHYAVDTMLNDDLPQLLRTVEKVLELLDAHDEEAANNRLSIDQRDPNMDGDTVAMLSGVVMGRMQTSELVRQAIKKVMEGHS